MKLYFNQETLKLRKQIMDLQRYERPEINSASVQTIDEGSSFPFSPELLKVYFQP